MVALIVLVILGFVFLIHMAKGGYVGTGGTILVLFVIALIISAALSINISTVIIIMLAVIIVIVIANACINDSNSPRQIERHKKEVEFQREQFLSESRKWGEDKFTLFGTEEISSGKDFSWREALEKLALLEEGYFPYRTSISPTESTSEKTIRLNQYALEKCHYKIESTSTINNKPCSFGYLALSDVENYISFRKSIGGFYRPSIYEEVPQEIRNLFYAGKVTIGVPFGQDGHIPCQVMTIPEAREFMKRKMEERFQKYLYSKAS